MNNNILKLETDYEPIDLCACYEPIFYPPLELVEQWHKRRKALLEDKFEPTLENTSHYGTELDGTTYFYCGNTRIKVTEHFADDGRPMESLIEDVIRFSANRKNTELRAAV